MITKVLNSTTISNIDNNKKKGVFMSKSSY